MMPEQPKKIGQTPPLTDKTALAEDVELTSVIAVLGDDAEAISVAPNWKLVWWRFKKHRLALIGGVIIIFHCHCGNFSRIFQHPRPRRNCGDRFLYPCPKAALFS